jgi:outer membrane protein OmpA-like peptidoglycan-associated protein
VPSTFLTLTGSHSGDGACHGTNAARRAVDGNAGFSGTATVATPLHHRERSRMRLLVIALTVSTPLALTVGCASTTPDDKAAATTPAGPADSAGARERPGAPAPVAPVAATGPRSGERPSVPEATPPAPREERVERDRVAEALSARVDEVSARLSRLWASRNRRTVIAVLHVHFPSDREEIDDGAQAALGQLVEELRRNENLVVDVEGYTDMVGARDHNLELSRRRAEAVRLYLVEQGVELSRVHAIGRGPLADPAVPADRKRRVTIKLIAPSE